MLKSSFLMMLPLPTLTQASISITKSMVRQRLHHEERTARSLVMFKCTLPYFQ